MKKAAAPTKAEIKFAEQYGATKGLIDQKNTPRKKSNKGKSKSRKMRQILLSEPSQESSGSETNNQVRSINVSGLDALGVDLSKSMEMYRSMEITGSVLQKKKPHRLSPLQHELPNIENVDKNESMSHEGPISV